MDVIGKHAREGEAEGNSVWLFIQKEKKGVTTSWSTITT